MKKKKILYILAFFCLILISGCQTDTSKKENSKSGSEVSELISKFDKNSKYDYDPKVRYIDSDQPIEFEAMEKLAWDVYIFSDFEAPKTDDPNDPFDDAELHDPVKLFSDYTFKSSMDFSVEMTREGDKISFRPINSLKATDEFSDYRDDNNPKVELEVMSENNWGIHKVIYAVQYNDLQTGKLLKKPKVYTYVINNKKNKLESPTVTYKIGEKGALELSWQTVKGATEYYIVSESYRDQSPDKNGKYLNGYFYIIDKISDTTWSSFKGKEEETMRVNHQFINYDTVEEDELYGELDEFFDKDQIKKPGLHYEDPSNITIIASDGKNISPRSNEIKLSEISSKLPRDVAFYTLREEEALSGFANSFDKIEDIPYTIPVSMIDGKTKFFPIAMTNVVKTKRFLEVTYGVVGTPFVDKFWVDNYDSDYIKKLEDVNKKIATTDLSGSIPKLSIKQKLNEAIDKNSKEVARDVPKLNDQVFATSALSYYLAANMMNNAEVIDLSAFESELNDHNLLNDTFNEARLQNPLIQQIQDIILINNGKYLRVYYSTKDKQERIERQNQIREKLDKVAKDISEQSSNPLEQIKLINQYVVDNSEYDYEAYDKERSNKSFTGETEDAYSTYGVAVKGKGVCISYAQTFDYLVKKLKLEGILVTGVTNGNAESGHAWNAVKIDGKWSYFDSTWNDSGDTEKYFNLPMENSEFSKTHILDEDYILDPKINDYKN